MSISESVIIMIQLHSHGQIYHYYSNGSLILAHNIECLPRYFTKKNSTTFSIQHANLACQIQNVVRRKDAVDFYQYSSGTFSVTIEIRNDEC